MSVEAITLAMQDRTVSGNDRVILFVLADMAARHGPPDEPGPFVCWPSHATIAEKANVSLNTVGRCIGRLTDAGLVAKHRPDDMLPNGAPVRRRDRVGNVYTLRLGRPTTLGVRDDPPNPTVTTPQTGVDDPPPQTERPPTGGVQNRNETKTGTTTETKPVKHVAPDGDDLTSTAVVAVDPADEHTPDVVAMTRLFASLVVGNGHTVPTRGSRAHRQWYKDVDLLLRLGPAGDGAGPPTLQRAEEVIRWALVESDFWPANIRSPAKLRKQWTMLDAQCRRDRAGRTGGTAMDALQRRLSRERP